MALEVPPGSKNELVNSQKGLVSRDIFVDPELYEIEKERVFARCWLFVGFEDQIKKPGDYFVPRMGEESVILSRDRDNTVHVFLNSRRHRGMKVCRYDEGNTPVFTCPYHGWSYAGDGSLVGVPRYKDAYREELDKSQWGLVEVAHLANFHGTIWATWDPDTPSFDEYLGDMKVHLDLFFNSPDGTDPDLEVIGGVYKWLFPANWKFGAENFLGDDYHGVTTHRSVDVLRISPSGQQGRHTEDNFQVPAAWFDVSHHGSGRLDLRLSTEDLPYTNMYPNNPAVDRCFRAMHAQQRKRLGKRARLTGENGNIFPNTTQGTYQSICVWHPHGVDWTECWRWYWLHRDAPQEVKDLFRHYFMRYGRAGGADRGGRHGELALRAQGQQGGHRPPLPVQLRPGPRTRDQRPPVVRRVRPAAERPGHAQEPGLGPPLGVRAEPAGRVQLLGRFDGRGELGRLADQGAVAVAPAWASLVRPACIPRHCSRIAGT